MIDDDELAGRELFATQLEACMKEHALTQSELSRRTGITQNQISRYLGRKCSPSVFVVQRLAREFDVTIEEMLGATPALARR
ncbi:Helix-turn-helix domain protein [Planctomycetes bacterium Pan216]|uniref:Helix-turn-helix domain protein n=1 Tax=Kolteria novifilia TaxID=2527975 RepID=A0A518B570_9BACT|nr:Helix-turn-helix domain protein [Planctomycetes bacterium Pan216]